MSSKVTYVRFAQLLPNIQSTRSYTFALKAPRRAVEARLFKPILPIGPLTILFALCKENSWPQGIDRLGVSGVSDLHH